MSKGSREATETRKRGFANGAAGQADPADTVPGKPPQAAGQADPGS